MSGHRIEYVPREEPVRQRRPRLVYGKHLDFIRRRSCIISGMRPVEAAHLRIGCRLVGKRSVGVGEKPSDLWTLPLAPGIHRAQHAVGDELRFWRSHNIENPFQICLALFVASMQEDEELADQIVSENRLLALGIG